MILRVRDIPAGVKFQLIRNGHRFTMVGQHETMHYLYHVIAHPWSHRRMGYFPEKEKTLNGQSYVKPIVRAA